MTALKDSQTPSPYTLPTTSSQHPPAKLRPSKRMTTPSAPSIPFRAHRPSPLHPTFLRDRASKSFNHLDTRSPTPPSQQFRSSETLSKLHRFRQSLALPKAWNLSDSIPAPSQSCVKDHTANFEVQRNSIRVYKHGRGIIKP